MFGKLFLLLSGNTIRSVTLFLRTIIIARLISVEDFGIAATLTVSVAIIQLASTLGLDRMIVQDRDGANSEMQEALQGFQLLRGLFGAVVLYLLAGPMARFLGTEDLVWAYQTMALVPIFNGLAHLDVQRLQRRMQFRPIFMVTTAPSILSLLLIWPADALFNDFRVMMFTMLAQQALTTVMSHVFAERRFRVRFDPAIYKRGLSFGWPLMIDGFLLFLVFHGEKMIVGRELGMVVLGVFSMGTALLQSPASSVTASLNQFLLPQLSAAQDDDRRFNGVAYVTLQAYILTAILLCMGVLLLGAPLVHLALGAKYDAVVPLLLWLAIAQALRSAKNGTALVSLARASTENGPIGNVPRVVTIFLSWLALTQGAGLDVVIALAIAGELAGFLLTVWLMRRRVRVPLRPIAAFLGGFLVFLALLSVSGALQGGVGLAVPYPVALIPALIGFGLTLPTMRPLFRYLRKRQVVAHAE